MTPSVDTFDLLQFSFLNVNKVNFFLKMSSFLQDKLPVIFENEVESISSNIIVIRSNIRNLNECNMWVSEYGKLSNTKWNARNSKPCGERFICSKKFVCHHSSFQKIPAEKNKRSFTKNSSCLATINIKVKLETAGTKKKDSFIRKGLFAVIKLNNVHNHSLNTAEALKFLPAADCKEKFIEYFNNGMGVADSCKYHKGILEFDNKITEIDMANRRINPSYRAVQYWYDEWRLNLRSGTGNAAIEHYDTHKVAPTLPRTVKGFNPNDVKAPKDCPTSVLPKWAWASKFKGVLIHKQKKMNVEKIKSTKICQNQQKMQKYRMLLPRTVPFSCINDSKFPKEMENTVNEVSQLTIDNKLHSNVTNKTRKKIDNLNSNGNLLNNEFEVAVAATDANANHFLKEIKSILQPKTNPQDVYTTTPLIIDKVNRIVSKLPVILPKPVHNNAKNIIDNKLKREKFVTTESATDTDASRLHVMFQANKCPTNNVGSADKFGPDLNLKTCGTIKSKVIDDSEESTQNVCTVSGSLNSVTKKASNKMFNSVIESNTLHVDHEKELKGKIKTYLKKDCKKNRFLNSSKTVLKKSSKPVLKKGSKPVLKKGSKPIRKKSSKPVRKKNIIIVTKQLIGDTDTGASQCRKKCIVFPGTDPEDVNNLTPLMNNLVSAVQLDSDLNLKKCVTIKSKVIDDSEKSTRDICTLPDSLNSMVKRAPKRMCNSVIKSNALNVACYKQSRGSKMKTGFKKDKIVIAKQIVGDKLVDIDTNASHFHKQNTRTDPQYTCNTTPLMSNLVLADEFGPDLNSKRCVTIKSEVTDDIEESTQHDYTLPGLLNSEIKSVSHSMSNSVIESNTMHVAHYKKFKSSKIKTENSDKNSNTAGFVCNLPMKQIISDSENFTDTCNTCSVNNSTEISKSVSDLSANHCNIPIKQEVIEDSTNSSVMFNMMVDNSVKSETIDESTKPIQDICDYSNAMNSESKRVTRSMVKSNALRTAYLKKAFRFRKESTTIIPKQTKQIY